MSGNVDRPKQSAARKVQENAQDSLEREFKPPLKPHRQLFIALLIAFGGWAIFLLVLYFRTIYPLRHR